MVLDLRQFTRIDKEKDDNPNLLRAGLHYHQLPPFAQDMAKRASEYSLFDTVLDIDADWYIRNFDAPNKVWLIRCYDSDIMGQPNQLWADHCYTTITKWQAYAISVGTNPNRMILQIANELNLGIEHGGDVSRVWNQPEDFRSILLWYCDVVDKIRGRVYPGTLIGAPFDSPGQNDVDGYTYIKQLGPLLDRVDFFGGHYYAEGPELGGFYGSESNPRIYYSDRVLTVRSLLDEMGYSNKKILIGETNRKQVDVQVFGQTLLKEFSDYLDRIKKAVWGVSWFVWSSGNPAFWDMGLGSVINNMDRLYEWKQLTGRFYQSAPQPPPEPQEPAPKPIPVPEPLPPQIDLELVKKYNLKITNGSLFEVKKIWENADGRLAMRAYAPVPNVEIHTNDNIHHSNTMPEGAKYYAEITLGGGSWYTYDKWPNPSYLNGFYTAKCGDAIVENLGMYPFTNHNSVWVEFGLKQKEITKVAYSDYEKLKLRTYAAWADARIHNDEDPRDSNAFIQHLTNLGADYTKPHDFGFPYPLAEDLNSPH